MGDGFDFGDVHVMSLVSSLQRLMELRITRARKLTDASVHALSTSCPLLARLSLGDANLSDRAFVAEAGCQPLRALTSLHLDHCRGQNDTTVHAVAQGSPLLQVRCLACAASRMRVAMGERHRACVVCRVDLTWSHVVVGMWLLRRRKSPCM